MVVCDYLSVNLDEVPRDSLTLTTLMLLPGRILQSHHRVSRAKLNVVS